MRSPDKPRHSRLARLTALAVAAALSLPALTGCVRKTPPLDPDTTTWFPLPTLPTGASTWYPPGWTSTPPTPTALPTATSDPLYQEAVQVYQRFFDEYNQVRLAGGADELPPALTAVLTGSALDSSAGLAAHQKAEGIRYLDSPEFSLHWTRPYDVSPPPGAIVGIQTCEEVNATITNGAGAPLDTSGDTWWLYQVFFTRTSDKQLAVFNITGDWVESCPA